MSEQLAKSLAEQAFANRKTDLFEMIKEFHQKFGIDYDGPPRELPPELSKFRRLFMSEELMEYIEAWQAGNLEKQFDALIDLVYVAIGTAYLQGFDFNEGYRRVHAANLNKIRATDKHPSLRGFNNIDVVKPDGWVKPDLLDLVRAM